MTIAATASIPTVTRNRDRDRRLVRIWLYALATMVLLIVFVGGATRLTDSGLSITEWQPIHGAIPPLNDAEWQEEFLKYQEIPQFQVLHPDMTLSEFKGIFWWEWSHRLLARFVGVVFAVPFLFFLFTGRLEKRLWPQLVTIFALGGLQGLAGWLMVYSGVEEGTTLVSVDEYRLAIHLILASLIFSYLLWVARGLRPARPVANYPDGAVKTFGNVLIALLFFQLFLGALVAGLDAWAAGSGWPTMNGELIPTLLFERAEVTVHFFHRLVAYLIAILVVVQAIWLARRLPGSRVAFSSYRLVLLVVLQMALGIATVIASVSELSVGLALGHQVVAFVLLGGLVIHRRGMNPPIPITG
ncbi:MAG: COX15/CtaA family protein [Bauldia sp.]|nr:COX15/CtaA family protein [Bauldia sp.]